MQIHLIPTELGCRELSVFVFISRIFVENFIIYQMMTIELSQFYSYIKYALWMSALEFLGFVHKIVSSAFIVVFKQNNEDKIHAVFM